MMLYRILCGLAGIVVRLLTRFEVRGVENIPPTGACVIAANHFHALDPLMLAIAVPRPVAFMAKEELFRWPVFGWLVRKVGVFPVKRGRVDVQAVRHSLEVLQQGGALGIFPEGTRSKSGEVQEAFGGAALLAARSGAVVVPVALSGRYRLGARFRVNVGKPIQIESAAPGRPTAEERSAGTRLLMQYISELLAQIRVEGR